MTTLSVPEAPPSGAAPTVVTHRLQEEFDELLHALCLQRRSAVVLCPDHDELDAVAGHLARCLRRRSGVRMERLQATGTESLLGRFNALVEAMPLEAARRDDPNAQVLMLWVMHLTRRLELPEVRLLLNMVRSFPGTGVRLLLLCSGDAASAASAKLVSSWGSSLHRWTMQQEAQPRDVPVLQDTREAAQASRASLQRVALPEASPSPRWRKSLQRIQGGCRQVGNWCGAHRLVVRACAAAGHIRRSARPMRRQLLWGFGGLLVSLSGAAAAWWQARPSDSGSAELTPMRRPVPEIVELLDDTRPSAVRLEHRS